MSTLQEPSSDDDRIIELKRLKSQTSNWNLLESICSDLNIAWYFTYLKYIYIHVYIYKIQ